MKRWASLLCFALAILLLIPACKRQAYSPQMALSVSSWSGFDPEYKPDVEEYVFDIYPQFRIDADNEFCPTFTVIEVTDEAIHIRSDCILSPLNEDGGINLSSDQQDFSIPFGQSLTLVTCTTDFGMIYTFTYTERGNIS